MACLVGVVNIDFKLHDFWFSLQLGVFFPLISCLVVWVVFDMKRALGGYQGIFWRSSCQMKGIYPK